MVNKDYHKGIPAFPNWSTFGEPENKYPLQTIVISYFATYTSAQKFFKLSST